MQQGKEKPHKDKIICRMDDTQKKETNKSITNTIEKIDVISRLKNNAIPK